MSTSTTPSTVEDAFLASQRLSSAQKLELISRLWESVRQSGEFRPSAADIAEFQRRSAELDAGTVAAIPGEVFRESIRARMTPDE